MKKMKKIIFGVGTIATVIAPSIGIVACGNTDEDGNTLQVDKLNTEDLGKDFTKGASKEITNAAKLILKNLDDKKTINALNFKKIECDDPLDPDKPVMKENVKFDFKKDKFYVNGDNVSRTNPIEDKNFLATNNLAVENGALIKKGKTTVLNIEYMLRMAVASTVKGFQYYWIGGPTQQWAFLGSKNEKSKMGSAIGRGLVMSMDELKNANGKYNNIVENNDYVKYLVDTLNTKDDIIPAMQVVIYDTAKGKIILRNAIVFNDKTQIKSAITGDQFNKLAAVKTDPQNPMLEANNLVWNTKDSLPGVRHKDGGKVTKQDIHMMYLSVIGGILNTPETGTLKFSGNNSPNDLIYTKS